MVSCGNSFESSPEMETFLCERLLDSDQPISERFRALFSLRNLKGPAPRNALVNATRDSSNLLAHEAAFALGQMQDIDAVPALEAVLNDLSLHPIVRHEAAEALGAIGLESNVPLLKNSLAVDPALEVQETCELALRRIEEMKNVDGNGGLSIIETSPFLSVDPAAPASCYSVEQLREVLLNEDKGMYERYAALFALRNCGGDDAITAIIDSLAAKSALLRHEMIIASYFLRNFPGILSPSSQRAVKLLLVCWNLKNQANLLSTFSCKLRKLRKYANIDMVLLRAQRFCLHVPLHSLIHRVQIIVLASMKSMRNFTKSEDL
ncbi:deoxyhypusine hydroxylase isoform X1 [Malania oleifera]|uniref:deoxyhypusine hydroxylase isoform X1 n=1 Tax=Malania oleifera TaxID=397392 RepID=UPI0025AE16CB|nr:deoxyhypusine hydroxylase isoform X1 [Malania oleifera]XP_057965351.1 deoxyhypusine hydroxylase isoform X1 [Malania oleifera]XP_057965352.1 deoxyhypusine hydroxylase isoform X1 [Malania oleifera]XP_057965353.1 deoxyhypusine hydroxylase isoform X1 [Malania oleifera]XP_057965354.1 deoxyhypusine hydroxylase isoform X1 [Malania oleifera]